MMKKRSSLLILYWIVAFVPLVAAAWVYVAMPARVEVAPGVSLDVSRWGVWVLPIANVLFSFLIYALGGKLRRRMEEGVRHAARLADIGRVFPALLLFVMVLLSAVTLSAVYGYYALDEGGVTARLFGRVIAIVLGVGVSMFAMELPRARKNHVLALHWSYTKNSQTVWLKTHKLATRVLYIAGALMIVCGIAASGIHAAALAAVILLAALLGLYLYAKRLYEDDLFK